MMRILLTGANGLLGSSLLHNSSLAKTYEVLPTSYNLSGNAKVKMDISSNEDVIKVFEDFKPHVLINAGAMTNVDLCEDEKERCYQVNTKAIEYLSRACLEHGTKCIHVSTDFVFDGKGGPYSEVDKPNPQSYYATCKLEGEKILASSDIESAIVRTILVYGKHSTPNIATWLYDKLKNNEELSLVDDHHRMPTYSNDLAYAIHNIIKKEASGLYHISGSEMMTPFDMGIKIAEKFSFDSKLISRTNSSVFKQKAIKPKKTGFILDKAIGELSYSTTRFDDALDQIFS